MKRKLKTENTIYSYLKAKGILENGSHEDIQKVRKEYWKDYKRKWRIDKRRKEKEFTISFKIDELKILNQESKRHKLSPTQFIKQTTFAYLNKSFIVPDIQEVKRISQLLAMTYNSMQELFEENKLKSELARELRDSISQLERDILPILHHPKTIEEFLREYLNKDVNNKTCLLELINSF